jgi:phosphoglycerol transferase MdoB-like AlkP superfamily enzyme
MADGEFRARPPSAEEGAPAATETAQAPQSGSATTWIAAQTFAIVVDNLRRHGVCLALAALLATYLTKIFWYIDAMERVRDLKMGFLAFIAADLVLWALVVAVVLGAEMYLRHRWLNIVLTTLVATLAFIALCNVFYLLGTGGQLDLAVVRVVITRFEEIIPIVAGTLETGDTLLLVAVVVAPLLIPHLFKAKWRKDQRADEPRRANFVVPLVLLALAGLGVIEQRKPDQVGWRLVAANVHATLVRDLLNKVPEQAPPPRPNPAPSRLADAAPAEELPNIVVFIYEATAMRVTSLAPEGPPVTPFLAEMARQGLQATSMRSVMPHTSKSLFSILCGVFPAMQTAILETADNFPMYCLARILAERGYSTAFMQSADGRFEQRPKLVANFGFDTFVARQDIRPAPQSLGYLAADDRGLVAPALEWTGDQTGPFLLVVLTSAAHHPYEVPSWIAEQSERIATAPPQARYSVLVSAADRMAQTITEGLDPNGRPTIVAIMGDHGEAFGEHGLRQHDNVYYEEGLHVPFVIRAPDRVPAGQVRTHPTSLLDLTPTILELAGIPYEADRFDGRSLVSNESQEGTRSYFACWYDRTCVGFVEGDTKFVALPRVKSWLTFDLAEDRFEQRPRLERNVDAVPTDEARRWYASHRYRSDGLSWSGVTLFDGAWQCDAGRQAPCHSTR